MKPTEFIASVRANRPAAAYFFRGPDRFLHEECRAAVVSSLPADAREWCLAEIEYDPGHLQRELEGASQMPMLGGHNYFIFSDPDEFKRASDEDFEALQAYLERPSPFATLIFIAVEPDRRRRFVQLLEKKSTIVEMRPLSTAEAATWVKSYMRDRGLEIDPALAADIAARFEIASESGGTSQGVNLLWLRTEMEKLLTARSGAKQIRREDLDLLVSFREEHEIGKLLAALADRKLEQALMQLRGLLAGKEPETLILWCVGDLVRQALKSGGQFSGRGGWSRFSNPFSTQELAPRMAKNYSREELAQSLRFVRRADLGIKSSWKEARILLEFLVWQIVTGKESEGVGDALLGIGSVSAE